MPSFSKLASPLALLATQAVAYPFMGGSGPAAATERTTRSIPGFDASAQLVDVTGDHAFSAPSSTDIRGPCPGLNALANHNYLPHNGVATITQFIDATTSVYGMGVDLATFLAVLGATLDGDGTSWSIGGPPPTSLSGLAPGLLGYPQGISGSHNKYEADSSPTRPDLYEYGNDYKVIMSQFQQLYDMQPDASTANYNLDVLGDFRSVRWDQSVANNPYFFNGPFTGVAVSQAAFTFIYRFMANHTAEYPEGILNKDVLKSFFSISGPEDDLTWVPGQERIPDNWYRRAYGDEYTIPYFNLDMVSFILRYPKIASVGGNTGTVNTFTGLDISDLTGGVFDAQSLLQGDNLACFVFQAATQAQPDLTSVALGKLTTALGNVVSELTCPQLKAIDEAQFDQYPGYSKLKTGGVY